MTLDKQSHYKGATCTEEGNEQAGNLCDILSTTEMLLVTE